MKYIFITGTPNSGKSTLAKKTAELIGGIHVDIDSWREELWQNKETRPWVDFFSNQDEKEYWNTTAPEQDWQNLVNQSEAFWPVILEKIKKIIATGRPAAFEAVNILPHLAKRDLPFDGIVLLNTSSDELLERLRARPRWGATEELQKIEALRFVEQAEFYKREAEKYEYKFFNNSREAEEYLSRLK
ncbi:MAG: AAA family ATPase [Candidatus Paceibacterota bacterium]